MDDCRADLYQLNVNSNEKDVVAWIESVPDLRQYANSFKEHAIDGESFIQLSLDDLTIWELNQKRIRKLSAKK